MQPPRNPWLCVMIVGTMSIVLIIGVLGMFLMNFYGKTVSDSLNTLIGSALGSLGTFLVIPRRGDVGAGEAAAVPSPPRTAPTVETTMPTRVTGP